MTASPNYHFTRLAEAAATVVSQKSSPERRASANARQNAIGVLPANHAQSESKTQVPGRPGSTTQPYGRRRISSFQPTREEAKPQDASGIDWSW